MTRWRRLGAIAVVAALGTTLLGGCAPAAPPPPTQIETPSSDFSQYTAQQPKWVACGNGASCADVYAPLDWDDPDGERITLRLAKQAATGTARGTLFVNLGGPGASGADGVRDFVDALVTAKVREHFDVIGWDPRGVGGSSAVHCLDDAELDDYIYGTGDPEADGALLPWGSDEWIEAVLDSARDFGAACAEHTGALLAHVDTMSTVRDLDMLRGIVGDDQLSYLGFSYGTRIGALYADTFPERSGRLVLDGALDPTSDIADVSRQQVIGIEGALRAYVTDCLQRRGCPLSGTPAQGMQQIGDLLDHVEQHPIRGSDGRMLYDSTLFTALVTPLYAQQLWPQLDALIAQVRNGQSEQAFRLADNYNDRVNGVYQTNLMEAFTAINCADYPRPGELDFDSMRAEAAETVKLAPITGRYQTFGDLGCAEWPVPPADVVGPVSGAGAEPLLVIGTTGDPATPYRWAQSLAQQLQSAVLVTFEGEGHTAYGNSRCVNTIVEDYFITGATPTAERAICDA